VYLVEQSISSIKVSVVILGLALFVKIIWQRKFVVLGYGELSSYA